MAKQKEKLKDVLGRIFKEKGLTVGQVSVKLGVPADSFRVRLSRNRFPMALILPLAALADLPQELEVLQGQFEFEISQRTNGKISYPANLIPLIKVIAGTTLETLTLNDFEYLLSLQRNFTQPITGVFIEEALRLR